MKVNRLIIMLLSIAIVTTVVAYAVTGKEEQAMEAAKIKVVRTQKVTYSKERSYLEYMGIVEADKTLKLSFSQAGVIDKVNVVKGEKVEKGQVLATLDAEAYELANQASQAQVNATATNKRKAEDALAYSKTNYKKMKQLFEAGVLSKDQFDQVTLDYQLRQQDYKAALEGLNQATASSGIAQKQLKDTTLYTDLDGYVVDVIYEKGETVAAGYPVIVVRSSVKTLKVGVSQKDIQSVEVGTYVRIVSENVETEGQVIDIQQVPDPQTRTYDVEVSITDVEFPLGTVAKAYFLEGENEGIKVPVNAIMNFNGDYVYTVEEGTVKKHAIIVNGLHDLEAYVQGLSDGDLIIVEGQKRVQENDPVMIVQ